MNRRVALGVLLAAAVAGCGREAWRDADARLLTAAGAARASGYEPLVGPHNTFGEFASSGEVAWRVHLEAHQSYFFAAACTAGCDALDFSVAEPHGAVITHDTTTGPTPRLLLEAPEEGDYRITFRYGRCSLDRCYWVAQVYSRPSH